MVMLKVWRWKEDERQVDPNLMKDLEHFA